MSVNPSRQARRKAAREVTDAVKKGEAVVMPTPKADAGAKQPQANIYEILMNLRKQIEASQAQVIKLVSAYENITMAYYNENQKLKEQKNG